MQFEEIKGLGASRIKKLQESGIFQPIDLLMRFPYKYVDLDAQPDYASLKDGDDLTLHGIIENEPKVRYIRKGLNITCAVLRTRYGSIEVNWFNQKFIARHLTKGKELYVTGKIKKFRNKISLGAPTIFHPDGKWVLPLYRSIRGVPQSVLDGVVDTLLYHTEITGYIPDNVRKAHGLMTLGDAFREVHRPHSIAGARAAAESLSVEKLSYNLGVFDLVKRSQGSGRKFEYTSDTEKFNKAVESLPFALTNDQKKALTEITDSLKSEKIMNRLLQGDVGCGKTVVALLAMYYAYLSGYQSVLMAPTEILAMQHYKSAIGYLEPLGVRVALLSGSLSKAERSNVLFALKTQSADVVIGTHALLGEDVSFARLSLIVTDEQQRFGVNQRGCLENKSVGADTLVMTATPIPRTLALCMYGELEQSFIKSLPSGRGEIITSIVPPNKHESMFAYIASRVKMGEQTYMVCPRIDGEDEENLVSVVEIYEKFEREFPDVSVGLLHGRLKEQEKSEIMKKFHDGIISVVVATTVVEVGIDVPNATNIIIFNAERYGLSQLHQLRGRVGRGDKKSYCFLPVSDAPDERLRFFCDTRDGFRLSEYDFENRGAGDFIGTRQHGESGDLLVKIGPDIISEAKAIAEETLNDEYAKKRLEDSVGEGTEMYVRSITMN